MIRIEKYNSSLHEKWDQLVSLSRNGTFLLSRNYMEYHSDRFTDYSLVAFKDDELFAIIPANVSENILYTHQGLTYGGWIVTGKISMEDTLELFLRLCQFLESNNIASVVYKPVPLYFQQVPYQDDLFPLSLLNAEVLRIDTSYIIDYTFPFNFQTRRMRSIKKAEKSGVTLDFNDSPEPFWNQVLIPHLQEKYGTGPVHSLAEIMMLQQRFPGKIIQCNAYIGNEIVAGATVYVGQTYAHTQYIASTDAGRESGAIDLLFHRMITSIFNTKRYFSFGTANNSGNDLNYGVAEWKSGWGAYTSPHFFFRFHTGDTGKLMKVIKH